jgi:predicted SAM-dependent methyltransferase
MSESTIRRLNWGCGGYPEPGWINSDLHEYPGVDIRGDIRDGLPLASDSIDYAVSIHTLPEIPYPDLVPVLSELRRVLKPGGVLRLGLPDLDKAIHAYLNQEEDYFLVPDEDVRTLSGKMIVQLIWYGYSRSMFTSDFTTELLEKAGYSRVNTCRYRETASSFEEIVALDNRERETLFIEAVK